MAEVSRKTVGIAALLGAATTAVGFSVFQAKQIVVPKITPAPPPIMRQSPQSITNEKPAPAIPLDDRIVVHVAGAVKSPGVYELKPGARNNDAIKAAGGPNKLAAMDGINLAAKLEDGAQLYVPNHQEHPDGGGRQIDSE